MEHQTYRRNLVLCFLVILVFLSCVGGNTIYDEKPAGFWAGLWHGFIFIITFIIGLFTKTVQMYEPNNVGNLYDLGFVLGVLVVLHKSGKSCWKKKSASKDDWEEIGERVETPMSLFRLALNHDLEVARKRTATYMSSFKKDGTRITENLDFVPVTNADQARN